MSCRIFSLANYKATSRVSGREGIYHVLQCPEWVNIIPVTPERQVVFIRQFRAGIRAHTLEIPGGMMDPTDKNPVEAARREMMEETGYDSSDVRFLGKIHPNPAIQNNFCHSFLAVGAHKANHPQPDAMEEVQTVLVPLDRVPELISTGEISHALVVTAFAFLFGLGKEFTE
jgi:8-oxo-dGTP pyrophosphatase MutT (NUDIX family)